MNKQSMIAIVVLDLVLAGGGRALADQMELANWWLGVETYGGGPSSGLNNDLVIACALGSPLATVTRAQVEADFAAGNVSQILNNDITVYCTDVAGDPNFGGQGFFSMANDIYYGTATPNGETAAENLAWFRLQQHLYCLAINAPSISAFLAMPASAQQMGMWTSDQTQYGGSSYAGYSYEGDAWFSPAWIMPVLFPALEDAVGPQGVTLIGGQSTGQYESPASDLNIQSWDGYPGNPCGALWLAPVQLPGDANRDGRVDINDLTIVLAHYGQTGMTWAQGEFTGDGTVDINDLTIVLANYGKSDSVGASAPGMAAAPEPSCLMLLGIGGVGLLACLWLKRR
jgi:hypothetical protein